MTYTIHTKSHFFKFLAFPFTTLTTFLLVNLHDIVHVSRVVAEILNISFEIGWARCSHGYS